MRAVSVERYGPPEVARVVDIEPPTAGRGQVLVRIEAAAVTAGDARMRSGTFPPGFGVAAKLAIGLRGPRRRVLGTAHAGVVEALGEGADGFSVGDRVAGMNGARFGAHAQYAAVGTGAIARMPDTISPPDAAAAMFGGMTAMRFLDGRVRDGSRVLVNGASGSVGSAVVQLARRRGAQVTAVTSDGNRPLVERIGAAAVMDYTRTPVSSLTDEYDLVFDAVGNIDRRLGLRLAGEQGAVILAVASLGEMVLARGRVVTGPLKELGSDARAIGEMIAAGTFDPLTTVVGDLDAVVEAYRRVDSGHKVGNLVVTPGA